MRVFLDCTTLLKKVTIGNDYLGSKYQRKRKKVDNLQPKYDHSNQDDDGNSHTNSNRNPLPLIAAWLSWSCCWWHRRRVRFEQGFYIRDVCPNSGLELGFVGINNINQGVARQDREVSDEKSKRLLHVKRYLERVRRVARVTRQ